MELKNSNGNGCSLACNFTETLEIKTSVDSFGPDPTFQVDRFRHRIRFLPYVNVLDKGPGSDPTKIQIRNTAGSGQKSGSFADLKKVCFYIPVLPYTHVGKYQISRVICVLAMYSYVKPRNAYKVHVIG
jgi:hypothetical protein